MKVQVLNSYRKYYKCGNTTNDIKVNECSCGGYMYLIGQIYSPKIKKQAERKD